jgi:hypothetical protein
MFPNLKPLVVVMGIALMVFLITRPLALRFMTPEDLALRRRVWITLTLTAFVSPSFWLYALIAAAVCAWAAQRDSNPPALYVMLLQVIPPLGLYIPMVGINQLFLLNNYRILALVVLLPLAVQLFLARQERGSPAQGWADVLLLSFLLLQLGLLYPYESFTNTLRRGFLLFIDVWLVYYVFSRACRRWHAIVDVMASFVLACSIFAAIALFETLKGWLLYQGLGDVWGRPLMWAYLMRGDTLRAQASVGHALALGYALAIGFAFTLYLGRLLRAPQTTVAMGVWMWVGLLAAYSRSPWVVAVVGFFAYAALQPDGLTRVTKYAAVAVALCAAVLVSPIGDRVVDNLPFVGTVDAATIEYRQRLAEVSWRLIQQNPWFGNPFVLTEMEELRQGQGIIDLVNSYASTALLYGLVGLSLLLATVLAGMVAAFAASRDWRETEPEVAVMGACLLAAMLATLVMMAAGSFGTILALMVWILTGLLLSYAAMPQYAVQPYAQGTPGWSTPPAPTGLAGAAARLRP